MEEAWCGRAAFGNVCLFLEGPHSALNLNKGERNKLSYFPGISWKSLYSGSVP